MRYTVLNPSRAGIVDDPLSWPWSTHRDVVGAIADPWVTAERLGAALGSRMASAQDIHAYVSGDPSVAIAGTPFPFDDGFTDVSQVPLFWVMQPGRARPLAPSAQATSGGRAVLERRAPPHHAEVRHASTYATESRLSA